MTTFLISDLHLQDEHPEIVAMFKRFLSTEAKGADALYILGDLFESWIGDDDDSPLALDIQTTLRAYTDTGVPTYFMHGNRDFLIGERFSVATGVKILPDPTVIDLYGQRTLLMHGDTLCTDDVDYQKFRAVVRDRAWQTAFLAKPLQERVAFAAHARAKSREHGMLATADITDVTESAVVQALEHHAVERMIHGHTHRPAIHTVDRPGSVERRRHVLGDWNDRGGMILRAASGTLSLDDVGAPAATGPRR